MEKKEIICDLYTIKGVVCGLTMQQSMTQDTAQQVNKMISDIIVELEIWENGV